MGRRNRNRHAAQNLRAHLHNEGKPTTSGRLKTWDVFVLDGMKYVNTPKGYRKFFNKGKQFIPSLRRWMTTKELINFKEGGGA